jgi:predicted ferric reductase
MAIVKKYSSEIVSVLECTPGTYTLLIKSLVGKFKYSPGQFLHLSLHEYDPSEEWPESRCFSMQSSPQEDFIKLTYSVKGNFTRKMAEQLNFGSKITLKLPFGELFTQEHSKIETVFISGGTGITPFLSLFTNSSFNEYQSPRLYAGFRNKELNLYQKEIAFAKEINSSFECTFVYQDKEGPLNISEILKKNNIKNTFFISGPPTMIKIFTEYLISNNISKNQIKTDDWE